MAVFALSSTYQYEPDVQKDLFFDRQPFVATLCYSLASEHECQQRNSICLSNGGFLSHLNLLLHETQSPRLHLPQDPRTCLLLALCTLSLRSPSRSYLDTPSRLLG